jgi:hypothetical protein
LPSFSYFDADNIASWSQQVSGIVNLIEVTVSIAGPARRHLIVTDSFAIDKNLIHAIRGDIQLRLVHDTVILGHVERFAEPQRPEWTIRLRLS